MAEGLVPSSSVLYDHVSHIVPSITRQIILLHVLFKDMFANIYALTRDFRWCTDQRLLWSSREPNGIQLPSSTNVWHSGVYINVMGASATTVSQGNSSAGERIDVAVKMRLVYRESHRCDAYWELSISSVFKMEENSIDLTGPTFWEIFRSRGCI